MRISTNVLSGRSRHSSFVRRKINLSNVFFAKVALGSFSIAAGQTFQLNFPEATFFEGPVSQLPSATVLRDCGFESGELDCLIGGPPCQSFSYNNHNRSATDARARLFEDYLRLVSDLLPKTIVMENVPGILTIGDGVVIDEIITRLAELGYDASYKILSADEYGVPQVRKRVFIIATRIGNSEAMFPIPTHASAHSKKTKQKDFLAARSNGKRKRQKAPVSILSAFGDLPVLRNGGGSQNVACPKKRPATSYQKEMRRGAKALYNHLCNRLGKLMIERVKCVPEGGNWRDIPFELLPAGMKRAHPSDHTKRYGRLSRKGLASTLLTKCDPHWGAYIHPTQRRTISVREAARLQGFPDRFQFAGESTTSHFEQIGNAVPIQVARSIAGTILKQVQAQHPKNKNLMRKNMHDSEISTQAQNNLSV
jgi:DNA (cytosine-5)-methyltransferase 1